MPLIEPSCARCEELLFEQIDTTLSASRQRFVRDHLAGCDRCLELARQLAFPAPDTVVSGVLAHTTGSTCERARYLLAERFARARAPGRLGSPDGPGAGTSSGLAPHDAELLRAHLQTCPECSATARALRRLAAALPGPCELQPDVRFVADVIAATSRATRPTLWDRVVARPRLVLELAYVGALALLLLTGASFSPLRGAVPRAVRGLGRQTAVVQTLLVVRGAELVRTGDRALTQLQGQIAWSSSDAVRKLRAGSLFDAMAHASRNPVALSRAWHQVWANRYTSVRNALARRWHGHAPATGTRAGDSPHLR